MGNGSSNVSEFIVGFGKGVIGKPPTIWTGIRRTGINLGLSDSAARDAVVLHNEVTRELGRVAFTSIYGNVDPNQVKELWDKVPPPTQDLIREKVAFSSGYVAGGVAVNYSLGRVLTPIIQRKFPNIPRVVVRGGMQSTLLILSMQGAMAWFWKDA